jgi:small subunit ribosomal protein S1
VLKEGDVVTLRIIKVDPSVHRIGLSLRRVDSMAYADMDWQALEGILNEEDEADTKPEEKTSD